MTLSTDSGTIGSMVEIDGIRYLSPKEVADLKGWTDSYVRRLLRNGKIKGVKTGDRQWLIKESEVMMHNNTYWNHNGKYQELSDRIQKLIPRSGECEDPKLELFRVVGNAYYDIYNNGACNGSRFKELRARLLDTPSLPFTPKEWEVLNEWLSMAADARKFYLFSFSSLTAEQRQILDLFEKLCDWSALNAKDLVS